MCYETAKPRYETHAVRDKTVTKLCYETQISILKQLDVNFVILNG